MNLTFISMLIIITLSTLIMTMIIFMGMKSINDTQKLSPFECGFNPMSMKRMPFSIHFFLIAVIFLIFDIEIVIILPMILTLNFSLTMYWMLTTTLFIMILIIGLYHEWYNGMLKWTS